MLCWSKKFNTYNSITVADVNPVAKLIINEKSAIEGEIITLNGSYSQPVASNGLITTYRFSKDGGATWMYSGANPIYNMPTTGLSGIYTILLRVINDSSQSDDDTVDIQIVSGVASELKFSPDTKISEMSHQLKMNKDTQIPIGSDRTEYDFLLSRPAERIAFSVSTQTPHLEEDINIVRDAWKGDEYVSIVVLSECETKKITYSGIIEGDIDVVQQFQGVIVWNFTLKIISRVESFISGKSGVITAVASGGSGLLLITSANHGLVAGEEVDIRGTTDYDGGNSVIAIVSSSQFRVRGTYTSTQTGSWIKKTYANLN